MELARLEVGKQDLVWNERGLEEAKQDLARDERGSRRGSRILCGTSGGAGGEAGNYAEQPPIFNIDAQFPSIFKNGAPEAHRKSGNRISIE